MKKFALLLICIFFASILDAKEVTLKSVPSSVEEFVALRDTLSKTPEGAAVLFFAAMMKLSQDKKMGIAFMTIALDKGNLTEGNAYKGYKPDSGAMYHIERMLDPRRAHLPYAYVVGTKFEDGYAAKPPYRFEIDVRKNSKIDDNTMKIFIQCNDGTMPRPMKLIKNDKGIWKVSEFSSFSLDVALPEKGDDI